MKTYKNLRKSANRVFWLLAIISLPFVTFSCKGYETREKKQNVTGEEVAEEFEEAVDTAAIYLSTEKEQFLEDYRAKIEDARSQIRSLKEELTGINASVRENYQERIRDLDLKAEKAEKKIESLKGSSEEAWTDLKDGVEAALGELDEAIEEAKKEFSN
jgi:myosin heavy subunit